MVGMLCFTTVASEGLRDGKGRMAQLQLQIFIMKFTVGAGWIMDLYGFIMMEMMDMGGHDKLWINNLVSHH